MGAPITLVVAWNHHPGSSVRLIRAISHNPAERLLISVTGVDICVGWRFNAPLLRPMHGRVLELDRFRWLKRDPRQNWP